MLQAFILQLWACFHPFDPGILYCINYFPRQFRFWAQLLIFAAPNLYSQILSRTMQDCPMG